MGIEAMSYEKMIEADTRPTGTPTRDSANISFGGKEFPFVRDLKTDRAVFAAEINGREREFQYSSLHWRIFAKVAQHAMDAVRNTEDAEHERRITDALIRGDILD